MLYYTQKKKQYSMYKANCSPSELCPDLNSSYSIFDLNRSTDLHILQTVWKVNSTQSVFNK